MDEEDKELEHLARSLATEKVDEEIAHHPELASNREKLLTNKTNLLKKEIQDKNNELFHDLNRASELIKDYFLTLPKEENAPFLKTLNESDWTPSQDPKKTLQENLGLPDTLLQSIYSFAINLQKKEDHPDASAILKFLIVLNPLIADFWTALGFSQLCLNLYPEALKSFQLSVSNDPTNLRGYYFTAYTLRLLKDEKASLEQVNQALTLKDSPSYPEWEPTFQEIKTILTKNQEAL